MAALRHAARRLCERALQRGAQQGINPSSRRSMFTSLFGAKPNPTSAAAKEELKKQFEKKKEEMFDMLMELSRTRAYPYLSWKALQANQLTTQLVGKVEPRPGDSYWRSYRLHARLRNYLVSYFCLYFVYMEYFWIPKMVPQRKNREAKLLSNCDVDLNNDMN